MAKPSLRRGTCVGEYARNGLDVTIVRPRTIVGHGRLGIFQILFEWIYQGENIPVLGDGKNTYQFVPRRRSRGSLCSGEHARGRRRL
jgi:hypothetical protein